MNARRELPGAASVLVRGPLNGPVRPGRVVGVLDAAVHLLDADGVLLVVAATDAVRLPGSVVLACPRAAAPFARVRADDAVHVGGGGLRVGPLTVRVARWWTPPRPRPPAVCPDRGFGALRAALPDGGLPPAARHLPDALADAAQAALVAAAFDETAVGPAASAADRLLGLGPGLTPSGDDVLCGFLLALHHLPDREHVYAARAFAAQLGARVLASAPARTTAVSAALLGHAARGDACPQLVGVLDALGGHAPLPERLDALLAVGHTSGADLAWGVLAAAGPLVALRGPPVTLNAPTDAPYQVVPAAQRRVSLSRTRSPGTANPLREFP